MHVVWKLRLPRCRPAMLTDAIVVAIVGTIACGDSVGSSRPPPDLMHVHLADGTTISSRAPVGLTIDAGKSLTYSLGLSAGDSHNRWMVAGLLSEGDALAGRSTLTVTPDVPSVGQVVINQIGVGVAVDGVLTVEFSRAGATGRASVNPGSLSATFDGSFGVSCWVPQSELSGLSGTDGGDSAPLVNDMEFRTSKCAPFRTFVASHSGAR
jgi:hypothetical protein